MKIVSRIALAGTLATMASLCAAAPCINGTLANYQALGATGCSIGGVVFGSFASLPASNNATPIPAGSISVTPGTGPTLTFQVGVSAGANTIQEAVFTYQVFGSTITASSISLTGTTSSGNGAVTEIQNYCLNGTFNGTGVSNCSGFSGQELLLGSGSNQATFTSVGSMSVTNDLTFDAGGTGSATGGTLTNQFVASGNTCSYSVTPGNQSVAAGSSTASQSVVTASNCSWQATSNASWIVITAGAGGTGNGTVTYAVQSNPTATPRSGTLVIAGQTITVTQSGTLSGGSSSTVFVTSLYQDLLNRAPDPTGLNFYVNGLNNGAITRSQLAAQFFNSTEFSGSGLYIIKLYLAVLRRDPEFSGFTFWFNAVSAGQPTTSVLQAFLSSTEFQSLYGNLSNQDFVTLLYQNVLARAPDPSGLSYYVGLLNSGALSRASLMDQFLRSPEYDTLIRPRAYANLLYLGFLRRSGDRTGLTFWSGVLANQANLSGVIESFITSPEYLARF